MNLFDNIIKNVLKAKDHQKLVHNVNLTREHKDLQRQLKTLIDELRQAENVMVEQDMDPFTLGDFVVHSLMMLDRVSFFLSFCFPSLVV